MEEVIVLPEWELLVEEVKGWEYDKLKTHKEIAEVMRVQPNTPKYRALVDKAIKELETLGILLVNKCGEGYYSASPKDHYKFIGKQVKKTNRAAVRGMVKAVACPIEKLTLEERTRHFRFQDHARRNAEATQATEVTLRLDLKVKQIETRRGVG